MPDQDLVQLRPQREDLLRVDLDVGRLPLATAQRRWIMMRECGSAERLPFAPAASSRAAMLAACPMQIVATSGLMNCIVS